MLDRVIYTTTRGRQPFVRWLNSLTPHDRTLVLSVVERCCASHERFDAMTKRLTRADGLRELELKGRFNKRVYLIKTAADEVILFGGSGKTDQTKEIANAKDRLADWRRRAE